MVPEQVLRKLETMDEFREFMDVAPQMKIKICAAIASILHEHEAYLHGPLLGDLQFASSEELQKGGVKPLTQQWTI
jgi:hypothetical protein